jgi:hypothetical protein
MDPADQMQARYDAWDDFVRTSPGAATGQINRNRVRQYFATHLGCTNVECGRALRLSTMAVGRHVASIRSEWCERSRASAQGDSGNANPKAPRP